MDRRDSRSPEMSARDLLSPLALLYRSVLFLRDEAYRRGWVRRGSLPRPVISVGNLTVGGTGKTSFVMYLAEVLKEEGFHPAVLSRGYRRKGRGAALVSDGGGLLLGPKEAGDEPYLLAKKLPGVPVAVGKDRKKAGELLLGKADISHFILDDGFQYRALERDLEVVMIDAWDPFGGGHLLPWGLLREPPSALRRADVVCISRADQVPGEALRKLRGKVSDMAPGALLLECAYAPCGLVTPDGDVPPDELKGKKVVALSGIGNPRAFERTLVDLGAEVFPLRFPDHHRYTRKDLERATRLAEEVGAEAVVTTEKDEVRLPRDLPFWTLKVEVKLSRGEEGLRELVRSLERG